MKSQLQKPLTIFIALALVLSGCRSNISRNDDGSRTVENTIGQQELQDAITESIADPLITSLTVSFQSGYILATGERQRLNDASKTDALTFRLDLGVSNGQLAATLSNAELDGHPIEQNRVDHWNQTLASRIAILGKRTPNGTLQSVSVTPEAVTMIWNVSR